jgi:hypothetical protein
LSPFSKRQFHRHGANKMDATIDDVARQYQRRHFVVSEYFYKKWRPFFKKVLCLDFIASQQKLPQFNMADAPQGAG